MRRGKGKTYPDNTAVEESEVRRETGGGEVERDEDAGNDVFDLHRESVGEFGRDDETGEEASEDGALRTVIKFVNQLPSFEREKGAQGERRERTIPMHSQKNADTKAVTKAAQTQFWEGPEGP